MKSARGMTGMPVVCADRRIGRVAQVCLSGDLKSMEGLWIDTGLKGARFVPSEQIALLGDAAVLTDCAGQRRRIRQRVLFRRAVSSDGRRLGAVVDALVDELTFRVEALELSRGAWDDLARGRTLVRRFHAGAESGDVILEDGNFSEGSDAECEAEW